MSPEIIGMHSWLATPAGRYLLAWERECFDAAVADIFGYHGVQLGLSALDALAASRIPHRWLAAGEHDLVPPAEGEAPRRPHALVTDFSALPFESASLDLVVMPHTLDLATDPHAALREAERVLMPDGKLLICGLNPASLWGLKQRRARMARRFGFGQDYLPDALEGIGYWRLRDWLRLLSFEVESGQFGCFRPAVRSQAWLDRLGWLDAVGDRWWPIFGAGYFLVATKRVVGMRLLTPAWKSRPVRADASVQIAGRNGSRPVGVSSLGSSFSDPTTKDSAS